MPVSFLKYIADLVLWSIAVPIAFWLRLDDRFAEYLVELKLYLTLAVPVKAIAIYIAGFSDMSWRKIGVRDLNTIVMTNLIVAVVLLGASLIAQSYGYQVPRSVALISAMFGILALSGARLLVRFISEYGRAATQQTKTRILIIGAGDAGTMAARELLRHPETGLTPIGFVDDARDKQKKRFLGIPVLGKIDDLPKICAAEEIEQILIAMPSADGATIRRIIQQTKDLAIKHRTLPALHDLLSGEVAILEIRDVDVQDLLRREPVKLDQAGIADYVSNQTVLITGAGGSIGAEIARQIAPFSPGKLLLLGRGENSIYQIHNECRRRWPQLDIVPVILNVQDQGRIQKLFEQQQPSVVFHAAAHKHVPLMETYPDEAVLNNVMGTKNVVDAAVANGVEHFVNVSTDKAVNPSSVMGATKRIAEHIVQHAADTAGPKLAYVSVRFGNVLGSRGSVIPLFKQQILDGGPVTVTDPQMTRYFMTIPEASQLVVQAGAFGENGRIYVLDMGEPVKILDLARDLITLSGLLPDEDIPIEIIGARPGEKLHEELFGLQEQSQSSPHPKIIVAQKQTLDRNDFEQQLSEMIETAQSGRSEAIRQQLAAMVPGFRV